jgi:ABC-2 type transport system permease protein
MLLKTVKTFWLSSLASEMEYRLNFMTSCINSLGQLAGTLFTINILYAHGHQFKGWVIEETWIVVGLFALMNGISTSVLDSNLSRIVQHVQRGTLDFVLLKPLDSQFQLSTRNLTPWGFPNIFFAICLLVYAGTRLHFAWHVYLLGVLPVMLSVVILYCLWFIVATTTIWFTKVWNATEVLRSFIEAGKYPLAAYHPALQFFFTFILPVAFVTTIPAEVMRGSKSALFILVEAGMAAVLLIASRLFWLRALRSYTSASS